MKVFGYKIISGKNKDVDIIRLDNNYVKFRFDNCSNAVLDFKEINLFYLAVSVFQYIISNKKLSIKRIYYKNIIKSYNAAIAIGHNANKYTFISKELVPELISIVYQHNIIFDNDIDEYKELYDGSKSDYFLVFDGRHEEILTNIVRAKYILAGSVRNNEIELNKKEKEYAIMYISEFRYYPEGHFRLTAQKFIVNLLGDYCKRNNKRFCVALSSTRYEKQKKIDINDELECFNQKKNKFLVEDVNSYELANKTELCVCLSSNLGVELLARGFKVLFLPLLQLYEGILKYPYYTNNESIFFYSGLDREIIFDKITNLLKIDQKSWNRIADSEGIKINFDENNTILKNIINETLNNKSGKLN